MRITFAVIVMFFSSCSTMKQNIQKNIKFTDKLISSLLEKNGNVFYLSSTYVMSSTVWTYANGKIAIYRLSKGKVIEQRMFFDNGFSDYNIPVIEDLDLEFEECGYELDGDGFGYRIKSGSEIEKQDLAIGISCFTKMRYRSAFLNKVVNDINTHGMWDFQ